MDDFSKKLLDIGDRIVKEAKDPALLKEIGDEAVELIRKRTKLGYGVSDNNADKARLKPLSEGYRKVRKSHGVDSTTSVAKSNLTNSGDMLKDLSAIPNGDKVTIGFKSGSSADKAEWVSQDRPFNNLSKNEIKQLRDNIESAIVQRIKDLLGGR